MSTAQDTKLEYSQIGEMTVFNFKNMHFFFLDALKV